MASNKMALLHTDRFLTQLRLAWAYRELGYEVLEQPRDADLPDFLRAFAPDLIAMKVADNVVVLIRTINEIRGAIEITQLAEVVARQDWWRFELISLGQGANQS
jgi:hypothetical protein